MALAASGKGAPMVRIDPEKTNALLAEPAHAELVVATLESLRQGAVQRRLS